MPNRPRVLRLRQCHSYFAIQLIGIKAKACETGGSYSSAVLSRNVSQVLPSTSFSEITPSYTTSAKTQSSHLQELVSEQAKLFKTQVDVVSLLQDRSLSWTVCLRFSLNCHFCACLQSLFAADVWELNPYYSLKQAVIHSLVAVLFSMNRGGFKWATLGLLSRASRQEQMRNARTFFFRVFVFLAGAFCLSVLSTNYIVSLAMCKWKHRRFEKKKKC